VRLGVEAGQAKMWSTERRLLGCNVRKMGVKVSADVGVSKTSVGDLEAGNDDFVTTEGLVC